MAYGAILGQNPNLSAYAKKEGLPVNDIRSYPVREGQSISAGDVVNVGAASDGEADTIYKDVGPQDNVENVITSSAVYCTDTTFLDNENTIFAFNYNYGGYRYTALSVIDNDSGKAKNTTNVESMSVSTVKVGFDTNNSIIITAFLLSNNLQAFSHSYNNGSISLKKSRTNLVDSTVSSLSNVLHLTDNVFFMAYSKNGLKVCLVNSETLSVISEYPLSGNTGANYISACKLPDDSNGNKRVCICFADTGDSNKGRAVIATIDSGNAVTFGDVVNFNKTVTSTSICSVACDSKRIFFSIGRNGYTSNLNLGDLVDLSISTQTLLNIDENIFVNVSPTPVVGTVTCTANTIIFNDSSYDIGEQFQYAEECSNMSAAIISKNSILIAYADNKNSNYGTTTILTVEGNQIAGSFLDNSSDAIALADGTSGQSIPVGFGGYCECPGVTEGDTIDSSGVSAVAVQDGWLDITDAKKRPVFGTYMGDGTYGVAHPIGIDVGFTPSMVVIVCNNTDGSYSANGTNVTIYRAMTHPKLIIDGISCDLVVTFTGTGISFYVENQSDPRCQMNENSRSYDYMAWR